MEIVERWRAGDGDRDLCVVRVADWADRRWLAVDVHDLTPRRAVTVLLAMKRYLERADRPLYSVLDTVKFPGAERLDRVLGLEPTDETVVAADGREMRVWVWRK